MHSEDKEMLVVFGIVALAVVVLFGGIVLASDLSNRYSCNNYEKVGGVETRYVTLDTCYINTERGWQRWDEYKVRAFTNED